MRKVLYFSIFAISVLMPLNIIFSQSSYEASEDPITFELLGTFNKSGSYDMNPLDWFRGEGGVKDLYLLMYNQAKEVPKRKALKRVMQTQNLTDIEKEALIKGENIAELYAYQGKSYGDTRQEALVRRFTEIQEEFDLEKDLMALEAEISAEAVTTEIFTNGELTDSGFDLLDDLAKIDAVLFGKPTTLFGESGPGAPAGAEEVGIGVGADRGERREEEAREEERRRGERPEEHEFSPAQCVANQDFNRAVSDFKKQEEEKQVSAGAGAQAQRRPEEAEIIAPEEGGYWERARACDKNKIFCLQVEPKFKTESSYQVTDNCIACHIEKINDAYRKTVSRGLIPAKATGNLIEMPRCKKGFSLPDSIAFNVIALPAPILTPANDDIIIKNDFLKEIVHFGKKYFGAPERAAGGNKEDSEEPIPNPIDLAEKRVLMNISETDITKVVTDINKEVAANRAEAFEILENYKRLSRSQSYATYYQALSAEMEQMNMYFDTFKKLFDMAQGPCTALFDKSICE